MKWPRSESGAVSQCYSAYNPVVSSKKMKRRRKSHEEEEEK